MTRALQRMAAVAPLVLLAVAVTGCGESYKFAQVDGVIVIDGKPAANISVQFMPDVMKGGKGPTSFGITDADGKFRLQTNDGKVGAVVGPHRVILVDMDEERPPQGSAPRTRPRVDPKYSPSGEALSIDVTGNGQPIRIELPAFRG